MAARYCSSCGAPLVAGSQFCSYCGTAVPGAPASAASAPPIPPAPSYGGPPTPYAPPPSRPRRSAGRLLVIIVVVFIVLILVGALAYVFILAPKPPPIQVGAINIWAPDNACALNANPIYFAGWNGSTGQVQTIDFGMPNYNTTACTLRSVTTNTTGFLLSAIQVPLTIPGNGTGSMNITITSPSSSFDGDLNLVMA